MSEKAKGIGLFGLIGMVVSSCIGSGVFAITGQLAGVASPGAVLVAWAVVGIGFAALALSLNNLGAKKPELKGIFQYAEEGFGPLAGFVSGWGYWLSAWLGNIAFATMMMSTLGYFFPTFLPGNTLPCVIVASLFMLAALVLLLFGGISVVLQTLDTYSVATDVNMAFINGTLPVMAFAAIIIHLRDIVRLIRTPAGEFNTAPKTE